MKSIYLWSIVVWFLLAVIATINGIVRNSTYKKIVGDKLAHYISTIVFISLGSLVMYLFFNNFGFNYLNKDLWIIGFSWMLGTILFEFVFGHYIFGNTWEKLFADYNIFNGRIWSLVLLFMLIGPWIFGKI